jgi:hypothetical protein
MLEGVGPIEAAPVDSPVTAEDALAVAVMRAAEAKQWDIVAQLARELEARRLERTGAAGQRRDPK